MVQRELGPLLSKGSTVFGPDDARFPNATERYTNFDAPTIEVVAVPNSEYDVSVIVWNPYL